MSRNAPLPASLADRIRLKRIYLAAHASDGKRVLVDRLWPRGMSKDRARLHDWNKTVAPSQELRVWFHADRDRWEEFRARYVKELEARHEAIRELADLARDDIVTLVTAAKDADHNHTTVLRDHLRAWIRAREAGKP